MKLISHQLGPPNAEIDRTVETGDQKLNEKFVQGGSGAQQRNRQRAHSLRPASRSPSRTRSILALNAAVPTVGPKLLSDVLGHSRT